MSKRCVWTPEEDALLQELVRKNGAKRWALMAFLMHNKTGKQCRERWHNHLDPSVKKGGWSPEEDEIICEMVTKIGKKWACIARQLIGRTDNAVKNRYHSSLRRSQNNANSGDSKSDKSDQRNNADSSDGETDSDEEATGTKSPHPDPQRNPDPPAHRRPVSIASTVPSLPSFDDALRGLAQQLPITSSSSSDSHFLPSFAVISAHAQKGFEMQKRQSSFTNLSFQNTPQNFPFNFSMVQQQQEKHQQYIPLNYLNTIMSPNSLTRP